MPELYTQHYHAYLLTSKHLYPHAKLQPNHHYAMDLTMLRTIVRRQRAYCQSASQHGDTRLSSILRTLVPCVASAMPVCMPIPTSEEIERLYEKHGDLVPPEIYDALLAYINSTATEQ